MGAGPVIDRGCLTQKIKSVVFDLDGVLVDSVPWHEEALNCALEEVAGFRIGVAENEEIFSGKLTKDKLLLLRQQGRLDAARLTSVTLAKERHLFYIIQRDSWVDTTKVRLFDRLSGYKTACVTNSNTQAASAVLLGAGLRDVFDVLISGDDVRHPKPSPEGYLTAMSVLRSGPLETVIVEDSVEGIASAQNTGAYVWEVEGPEEVVWENLQSFLQEIS